MSDRQPKREGRKGGSCPSPKKKRLSKDSYVRGDNSQEYRVLPGRLYLGSGSAGTKGKFSSNLKAPFKADEQYVKNLALGGPAVSRGKRLPEISQKKCPCELKRSMLKTRNILSKSVSENSWEKIPEG